MRPSQGNAAVVNQAKVTFELRYAVGPDRAHCDHHPDKVRDLSTRCLVPAPATVPAAATEQNNDENYNEKGGGIHGSSSVRCIWTHPNWTGRYAKCAPTSRNVRAAFETIEGGERFSSAPKVREAVLLKRQESEEGKVVCLIQIHAC